MRGLAAGSVAVLTVLTVLGGCGGDDDGTGEPTGLVPPFCTDDGDGLVCEADIDGEPGAEEFGCVPDRGVLRCVGDVDDRPGDEAFICVPQDDGNTLCNLAAAVPAG